MRAVKVGSGKPLTFPWAGAMGKTARLIPLPSPVNN